MKINRQEVYDKFNGKCAYTGETLLDDWQVDHSISRYEWEYNNYIGDVNNIDNLLPANRIINHYKRSLNIEKFRNYMLTFHIRLSKLPKKTNSYNTKKRIAYMNEVARQFRITIDKPFNGIFYYEKSNRRSIAI